MKKTQIKDNLNVIHKKDARVLNEFLKKNIVDVTITSPPYYDLKDYGYKKQIGYGQTYEDYLDDLKGVFKNVYECTKENGSLWIIIDSFRKDNQVMALPFDLANKLKEVGWMLQEVIIWAKDKTVPWTHHGQMRSLFEYILLFSKKEKYNFYIDEVRDYHALKKWWVKWPERYNPKGKTPDGLWHFDIPVQGSWGNGFIKHFCPLPEEMIARILKISTKEGDLVLDPFAGSGAVLAKANNMNRNYIGFELNSSYIAMFKNYMKKTGREKQQEYIDREESQLKQNEFNDLILDLRALKYAKIILQNLPAEVSKHIIRIFVETSKNKSIQKNAHRVENYVFYINKELKSADLIAKLIDLSKSNPLSKFGIEPIFKIESTLEKFMPYMDKKWPLFTYTDKTTHKFNKSISGDELVKLSKSNIILSKIKVNLNEKDYE